MSNKNVSDQELLRIKQGLTDLGDAVFQLSRSPSPEPTVGPRSLTGDAIHGGMITSFASQGIRDNSDRLIVVVDNDGITTDNIDVENIVGNTNVTGNLVVEGSVTAQKLHVDELTADIRLERSTPLEFVASASDDIYQKGLMWKKEGASKQFVLRSGPDRIWSSEPIDLQTGAYYSIDSISVLSGSELGPTVTKSSLTEVGVLNNLAVDGNFNIDQYVFWNGDYMRFGIGTETPNGTFGIVQDDAEFIIDTEGKTATFGTFSTADINIITDNTKRISISATGRIILGNDSDSKTTVKGKLGINVENPTADIETAGPVSFDGKRFEVSNEAPLSGSYRKGDVVWNSNPKPAGYVGWICTREGTPGIWKTFGPISS